MRVLVVEDQEKMSSFLKRGLNEVGYAVDVAETGQSAESLVSENEYDLIVLDVMLPDQNGMDTARHLRRAINAWLGPESRVPFHRHRGFGDQQPAAGALGVVLRHQRVGGMHEARAASGQRRHENAVGGSDRAHTKRSEKVGHSLLFSHLECGGAANRDWVRVKGLARPARPPPLRLARSLSVNRP